MEFLTRVAKHIIALTVLFVYTAVILVVGWFSAITYEAPAINFQRSVYDLIAFDKKFPAPKPGWESCTDEAVPGEKNFFIQLCQRTPK